MLSRRLFMQGLAAFAASAGLGGGYAIAEPWQLGVTRYRLTPPGWPPEHRLRIAALADIHTCTPWMTAERVAGIVERTNRLGADIVVLLGDYVSSMRLTIGAVPSREWAAALGGLKAPLGVHAILGNHDWWDDPVAQAAGAGPVVARLALERAGIPVLDNDAVRLSKDGRPFWLLGLADQLALRRSFGHGRQRIQGLDDLPATLRLVTDDAPAILLAHEPDIFRHVPARVSLTLSGHTHGGQIRIAGFSPVVPSRYGRRYAYGHIVEDGRHLIVSGGIGCSMMPVRFGMPPEIVLVELGAPGPAAV